jgi:hypothetical protein
MGAAADWDLDVEWKVQSGWAFHVSPIFTQVSEVKLGFLEFRLTRENVFLTMSPERAKILTCVTPCQAVLKNQRCLVSGLHPRWLYMVLIELEPWGQDHWAIRSDRFKL